MSKTPTIFTNLQATNQIYKKSVAEAISTAAAVTYTVEQVLGGLILRDPAGLSRADLLPTAASMFSEINSPFNTAGASFEFTIRNTADAAETITVTSNTGLTLSGTMTIAQNNSKRFLWVQTSATAATIYSLGTVVH